MLKDLKELIDNILVGLLLTLGLGLVYVLGEMNIYLAKKAYVEYPTFIMLTMMGYIGFFFAGYIRGKREGKKEITNDNN